MDLPRHHAPSPLPCDIPTDTEVDAADDTGGAGGGREDRVYLPSLPANFRPVSTSLRACCTCLGDSTCRKTNRRYLLASSLNDFLAAGQYLLERFHGEVLLLSGLTSRCVEGRASFGRSFWPLHAGLCGDLVLAWRCTSFSGCRANSGSPSTTACSGSSWDLWSWRRSGSSIRRAWRAA